MIYKKVFSEKDKLIGKKWLKNNCNNKINNFIDEDVKLLKVNENLDNSFYNLKDYGNTGKKKWPKEFINLGGRERLKELVRIRDKHTCQKCGKVWKEGMRKFDTHHIDEEIEGKLGLKYCNCKDISRMITLCHQCHLNLPVVRKKINKSIKKYLKNK